jgi:rhodanese-related sulfurtransferase
MNTQIKSQSAQVTAQKPVSRVLRYLPGDTAAALSHFYTKLSFETDAYDVYTDMQEGITDFIVIDARSAESYTTEHIPGAINFPHRQMNELTTASLPKDKVMVVYCDGIGCNASTKGAFKLASLGFRTKELLGGIDWWKRDGYPIEGGQASENGINCGCE